MRPSGSRPKGTHDGEAERAHQRLAASLRAVHQSAAGSQAAATSCQGKPAGSTRTAVCLSSGWRDCGQRAALVTALTPAAGVAAQHLVAPVHRDEGLCRRHGVAGLHRQHHGTRGATARAPGRRRARRRRASSCGCMSSAGSARMGEQARQRAGAAHAMPLVAQAAGGQRDREARVALLGRRPPGRGDEARAAVGRGEHAVGVQARGARGGTVAAAAIAAAVSSAA